MKNIFKSEIIRNSSILLGGNSLGLAISLLVYPILTRNGYTDADFGVFSLFLSIVGLLTVLGTGRYEESLVVSKDETETSHLLGFMLKLLSGFSFLLFIILLFFRDFCFSIFNIESIASYWVFIPLTVFFSGLFHILSNLSVKKKQFKTIASSNLSMNVTSSFFKLGFGFLSVSSGLIYANLIGQITGCISFYKSKSSVVKALKGKWSEQKEAGVRYKAYPTFNMARTFISYFSWNLPFLMLTGVFGESLLGLFSITFTVGFRPINLLVDSLFSAFFQKTASLVEEKKHILPKLKQFWTKTVLILIPGCIIVYIISPMLFKFVFSEAFEQSGIYMRILLPWLFMTIITKPLGFIPLVFHKQGSSLWIEIIYLLFRLGAIYTGIYLNSFDLAIILYSLVGTLFMIIMLSWYIYLIAGYEKKLKAQEIK